MTVVFICLHTSETEDFSQKQKLHDKTTKFKYSTEIPPSMLYVVSTPIGNLKDISLRALEVLEKVDLIAAEDTRRTGILLKHYKIKNKLISYNDVNKEKRTPYLIRLLQGDKEVALVSDAGTPGISDPGFYLIRQAIRNKIRVSPIPGANALLSALVCSGLPTDSFSFYGFLPKKDKKKTDFLKKIRNKKETVVVYESPHRILKTLKLMEEIIPNKRLCLARELTKKFEEFLRGTPTEILQTLGKKKLKGEIVLIIS